jgi:hypothetical protein
MTRAGLVAKALIEEHPDFLCERVAMMAREIMEAEIGRQIGAEADRLTPCAAAIRYGLGDPRAVPIPDAMRWAALAIEWADAQLRSDS